MYRLKTVAELKLESIQTFIDFIDLIIFFFISEMKLNVIETVLRLLGS